MVTPKDPRYRTRTAEMAPFWRAQAIYRHDLYDEHLQRLEWDGLGLDPEIPDALRRAGFSCYRLVAACPDWLLASVPGLGPVRIERIRRILPFTRAIQAGPLCLGRREENRRTIEANQVPGLDAYLGEQTRRQLAGEPELIPTEHVLDGLAAEIPEEPLCTGCGAGAIASDATHASLSWDGDALATEYWCAGHVVLGAVPLSRAVTLVRTEHFPALGAGIEGY